MIFIYRMPTYFYSDANAATDRFLVRVMSAARNLEEIDTGTFDVRCECGWTKQSLGVEAISHWIAEWEALIKSGNRNHFQEGAGRESMN
jgi:hypothetical protein